MLIVLYFTLYSKLVQKVLRNEEIVFESSENLGPASSNFVVMGSLALKDLTKVQV